MMKDGEYLNGITKEGDWMMPYVSELVGTALLVLLGDGVVANVSLNRSNMKGGGSVQITIAWGLAVLIPVCIFSDVSGAHFNPAVSIAMALAGNLSWSMVPGYIIAQMAGGFIGAILVYIFFKDQFDATEDTGVKLGCFCTRPGVRNIPRNIFCEALATFVLVFALLGFINVHGADLVGVNHLLVWSLIVSIGMSLGGATGYAINPARDLAPRFAHFVLPIKNKGSSEWSYAIVPLFGPIIGGIAAVGLFSLLF